MINDNRYFLLYTINNKMNFETISLLDAKLKRVYCGSPLGSDSLSMKQYGIAINRDLKIPIDKRKFLKIKSESYIELRKTNYLEFFSKYHLEEWIL